MSPITALNEEEEGEMRPLAEEAREHEREEVEVAVSLPLAAPPLGTVGESPSWLKPRIP